MNNPRKTNPWQRGKDSSNTWSSKAWASVLKPQVEPTLKATAAKKKRNKGRKRLEWYAKKRGWALPPVKEEASGSTQAGTSSGSQQQDTSHLCKIAYYNMYVYFRMLVKPYNMTDCEYKTNPRGACFLLSRMWTSTWLHPSCSWANWFMFIDTHSILNFIWSSIELQLKFNWTSNEVQLKFNRSSSEVKCRFNLCVFTCSNTYRRHSFTPGVEPPWYSTVLMYTWTAWTPLD